MKISESAADTIITSVCLALMSASTAAYRLGQGKLTADVAERAINEWHATIIGAVKSVIEEANK